MKGSLYPSILLRGGCSRCNMISLAACGKISKVKLWSPKLNWTGSKVFYFNSHLSKMLRYFVVVILDKE